MSGEFGEPTPRPWRATASGYVRGSDVVVAKCGNWADKELLRFNRDRWEADAKLIAACVNALDGIPDPAAQVDRWKAMEVWMSKHSEAIMVRWFSTFPPDEIARLAAEWKQEDQRCNT